MDSSLFESDVIAAGQGFGSRLRQLRRRYGMSQVELARVAGFSSVYVGMLERGERIPPVRTVEALALALGLGDAERAELAGHVTREHRSPAALPIYLTSFVGRRGSIALLSTMLLEPDARLVTITGPGGVGKTRCAVEVARGLLPHFQDGVAFIALDLLSDARWMASFLCESLGISAQSAASTIDALERHLRDQEALLLLDNFEHVASGVELVAALLKRCPRLRILCTSRIPLALSFERIYELPPLAASPQEARISSSGKGDSLTTAELEGLANSDVVTLFLTRAQARSRALMLTSENAADIARICRSLDGLPLAIELAAAQAGRTSLAMLAARLKQGPLALGIGPRDAVDRHRSLGDAFEWSYALLNQADQTLFEAISVFAGGCELDSLHQVSSAEPEHEIHDQIANLRDASLITIEPSLARRERVSMLRTVREFAHEKLIQSGRAEATHRSHVEVFLGVAEAAESGLYGPDRAFWLRQLELEHANFSSAIAWSVENCPDLGLRLVASLARFWSRAVHIQEGQAQTAALLASHETRLLRSTPTPFQVGSRAMGLLAAAYFATMTGDHREGERDARTALDHFSSLGDTRRTVEVLILLGYLCTMSAEFEQGRTYHQRALDLARTAHDTLGFRRTLSSLGSLELSAKRSEESALHVKVSIALSEAAGDALTAAIARHTLAFVLWLQGDFNGSIELGRRCLAELRDLGDLRAICETLDLIAGVEFLRGNAVQSARLLGGSRRLREEFVIGFSTWEFREAMEEQGKVLRAMLGADRFEQLAREGSLLSLEGLIELASSGRLRASLAAAG